MNKQIKPGMLCIVVGAPNPFDPNNGKVVEVLYNYYPGVWAIKANSNLVGRMNNGTIVVVPAGLESAMDERFMVPINDPDQEIEDERERSTELFQ